MTRLLRGKDLGVERERGLRITGEDERVNATECVHNLLVGEAEAQWRFASGTSCGRQRFFETELSYGLVGACDLGFSFDGSDTINIGERPV